MMQHRNRCDADQLDADNTPGCARIRARLRRFDDLRALGFGYQYEQRRLAARADFRTVEGPIEGLWTQQVRRAGTGRSYWQWEGFRVNGVPFSYVRNAEQNYFHNGGSRAIDVRNGMVVRVRYLERTEDGKARNDIVRLERARQ